MATQQAQQSLEDGLYALQQSQQAVQQLLDYCASSYSQSCADPHGRPRQAVETAQEFVSDTARQLTDNVLRCADSLTTILEAQLSQLDDVALQVRGVHTSARYTVNAFTRAYVSQQTSDRRRFKRRPVAVAVPSKMAAMRQLTQQGAQVARVNLN
ncbi:MAG: hypothetical protein MHM6MM_004795, partial [Cercozoa sp. M6MM]